MKRIIALTLCLILTLLAVAGCGEKTEKTSGKVNTVKKAQLVVAMNPEIDSDLGQTIAYSDMRDSMKSDRDSTSLTSMYDDTSWQWVYRQGDGWKKRATYSLGKWINGYGAESKQSVSAYSFVDDGTISVAAYATGVMKMSAYNDTAIPDIGIVMSVSGKEEEALCYTAQSDEKVTIPAGTITALESFAGVKTGFLAEDGTARRATVQLIVNNKILWNDQLMNSTAAPDGVAVTELNYPQISDVSLTAGDMIFFSVKLDAEVNKVEDITQPKEKTVTTKTAKTVSRIVESDDTSSTAVSTSSEITLLDKYDCRFVIIRREGASLDETKQSTLLRDKLIEILNTDVVYKSDDLADNGGYEILLGNTNRKESALVMEELKNARMNCSTDYIIRMVNNKLVFAANNDFSLSLAVQYFMDKYCKNDKSSIPQNLNIVYRPELKNIFIADNNIASYVIHTEKYPSYITVLAAKDLQNEIMRQTGYQIPIGKDNQSVTHEIMVGPTTAEHEIPENLNATDQYTISVSGGRLAVSGTSTTAVNAAVQEFGKELGNKTSYANGYLKTGSYEAKSYTLSDGLGLTWGDDFNGTAFNKRWYVASGLNPSFDGLPQPLGGFGEGCILRDGTFVQFAKNAGDHWVRNRLETTDLMNYRYGFFEIKIIMGVNNGASCSIWFEGRGLGGVNYPEFDLVENFTTQRLRSNFHNWPANESGTPHWNVQGDWVNPPEGESFADTYHYLGLDWTEDYVACYLDGEMTFYIDCTSSKFDVFEQSIVFKLGMAVSGGRDPQYSMNLPTDFFSDVSNYCEEQITDYVRIFQRNESKYKLKTRG